MNRGPGSDRNRFGDSEHWERQGNGGGHEQSEPSWREQSEERDRGSRQYAGSSTEWSGDRGRREQERAGERGRRRGGWEESGAEAGIGQSRRSREDSESREYGESHGQGQGGERWARGSERERGGERERFGGPAYGDWEGPRSSYADWNDPRGRGEMYGGEWSYRGGERSGSGGSSSAEGWGGGGSFRRDPREQESGRYGQSRYGFGGQAGSSRSFAERERGSWGDDPWSGAPSGGAATRERGLHRGKGPKGYRRSDERIREDVCERLEEHPELDASEIEVTVAGGEVTLQGEVSDRRDKRIAEDCAEGLPGVKDVTNQIRVRKGERGQEQGAGERKSSAATSGSQRTRNQGSSTSST